MGIFKHSTRVGCVYVLLIYLPASWNFGNCSQPCLVYRAAVLTGVGVHVILLIVQVVPKRSRFLVAHTNLFLKSTAKRKKLFESVIFTCFMYVGYCRDLLFKAF